MLSLSYTHADSEPEHHVQRLEHPLAGRQAYSVWFQTHSGLKNKVWHSKVFTDLKVSSYRLKHTRSRVHTTVSMFYVDTWIHMTSNVLWGWTLWFSGFSNHINNISFTQTQLHDPVNPWVCVCVCVWVQTPFPSTILQSKKKKKSRLWRWQWQSRSCNVILLWRIARSCSLSYWHRHKYVLLQLTQSYSSLNLFIHCV